MSSNRTQSQLAQLLQFHHLFSVRFHFGYCHRQPSRLFQSKISYGNHMSVADIYMNSVYTYEQQTSVPTCCSVTKNTHTHTKKN